MYEHMNEQGFSLLESMVTLCIIGILASIAYPVYENILHQQEQKKAIIQAHEIANQLHHYFIQHHTYQGANTLWPDNAAYTFRIRTQKSAFNIIATPKNRKLNRIELDEKNALTTKHDTQ